jgi:hypothetical protein
VLGAETQQLKTKIAQINANVLKLKTLKADVLELKNVVVDIGKIKIKTVPVLLLRSVRYTRVF